MKTRKILILILLALSTKANGVTVLPSYDPGGNVGRAIGSGISQGLSNANQVYLLKKIKEIQIARQKEIQSIELFAKILLEIEFKEVNDIMINEIKQRFSQIDTQSIRVCFLIHVESS